MKHLSFFCGYPWWLTVLCFTAVTSGAEAQLQLRLSLLDTQMVSWSRVESSARSATARTVSLGEPLALRIELINTGTKPAQIRASVDPAAGFVTLEVSAENQPFGRLTTARWEVADILVKPRTLAPGAKLVHETFLYGKLNAQFGHNYIFEQPGTYKLRAIFSSENPPVRAASNTLLVKVGAPVPQWKDLKEAKIIELFEGRLKSHPEQNSVMEKVEAVVKNHAAHPLSTWIDEKAKHLKRPAP